MTNPATLEKRALRQQLRLALKDIAPSERERFSVDAAQILSQRREWLQARSVLFYMALADELDLTTLLHLALHQGKIVALPRFLPDQNCYAAALVSDLSRDCAPGKFGILEPVAQCKEIGLDQADLILVPGTGFDTSGGRLGRGRGYYDRLLEGTTGLRCGAAFDCQIVPTVPAEPHDARMDFIVTPSRWIEAVPPKTHTEIN